MSKTHILAGMLGVVLLSCIAGGIMLYGSTVQRANQRAAALKQWRQRPFNHYTMIVEEYSCRQRVEVQAEQVIDVQNLEDCQRDARSITQLFALIERDGAKGATCITRGCACDDRISVQATYDSVLSYPREIYIRIAPEPNFWHRDYWNYLLNNWQLPDCSYMAGDKLIVVHELTPVP